MKYIIYISLILLLAVSCEQSIDIYKGSNGFYFDNQYISYDTVDVAWGLKASEIKEQKVKLKVRLLGNVAGHDRPFTIDVLPSDSVELTATEGIDYKPFPLEYAIPANEAETSIEITLLRAPHLVTEDRHLTIRLNETPELKFLYSRQIMQKDSTIRQIDIQRVIKMTEEFPFPWWWYRYGDKYFGKWSATKSILICDVMGIDREIWIGNLVGDFTTGYLRFCGQYMHRWLQDHPTLDEDGEPMEMGPDSKL